MYDRKVEDRKLTFVVSGMLWNRSLVMKDQETGSLWSHILGQAMRGPLEGKKLDTIPALMTDWQTWKSTHPETTVMTISRTSREFTREKYDSVHHFLIGMSAPGRARAWRFSDLEHQPLVNDSFGEESIVLWFDRTSATAFIYNRRVKDQTLTFSQNDGKIVDQQTGSHWDLKKGKATAGELEGYQLKPEVGISSFVHVWEKFYPNNEFWSPE